SNKMPLVVLYNFTINFKENFLQIDVNADGNYSEASSPFSPRSTISPFLNKMAWSVSRQTGFLRSKNSRSIPKCLNSSCCAFCIMAFADLSFSTDIRCSYQLIASASSVSETIIRANVLVWSDNSFTGSWYWSNDILDF